MVTRRYVGSDDEFLVAASGPWGRLRSFEVTLHGASFYAR